MTQPLVVHQSKTVAMGQQAVFGDMVPMPLAQLFRRWYGPIPPIKETRNQTGDWNAVGQSRTVVLVGGGSMHEKLTTFDPPHSFGYTLTNITGPLSPLVDHVEGEWVFEPIGTGTRVTWRWTIHPRSRFTAPLLPVFGKLWKGYARQSLEELSGSWCADPSGYAVERVRQQKGPLREAAVKVGRLVTEVGDDRVAVPLDRQPLRCLEVDS